MSWIYVCIHISRLRYLHALSVEEVVSVSMLFNIIVIQTANYFFRKFTPGEKHIYSYVLRLIIASYKRLRLLTNDCTQTWGWHTKPELSCLSWTGKTYRWRVKKSVTKVTEVLKNASNAAPTVIVSSWG